MLGVALPAALAGTALGILAGDGGWPIAAWSAALGAGGLAVAAAGSAARRAWLLALGVLLLALGVGAWRGQSASLPLGPDSVGALVGGELRTITGVLTEEPRPRGDRQQAVLGDLRIASGAEKPRAIRGRLLVWMPRSVAADAGDRLTFDGRLDAPRDFPGFAYREYLARQGIGAISSAFRAELTPGSREGIADLLATARRALLRGLSSAVPEPEAALGAGILLGVRTSIAPQVSEAFATAGLTHVVAISGWNIAIVATMAGAATRPLLRLRGGRWLAVAAAATAVGGYVLLTGASPSVVRAALMAAALVLARLGGSPAHAISALMLAALGMLLAAPPVLWDVGFQLSALATAGLVWFAAPLEARLRRWPALVREPVALTLAAQMATLPVVLLNFERLSLVSPAANVAVVPLVPVVMLCSAVAAAVGALDSAAHVPLFGDAATWAAGGAAWLYLRLMILAGQAAAAIPLASVEVSAPAWSAAAWYPLLLLLHRRLHAPARTVELPIPGIGRLARPIPALLVTLALLATLTLLSRPDGQLHVVMLDVGQGDAILVRAPSGATMLVDGGPDPDLLARRLGESLPFWQRSIDTVLLTHPHEDHVAGLLPVLERYRVGSVLEAGRHYDNPSYDRFRSLAAAEPGATYRSARAGMRIALDSGTGLTILFPSTADAEAPLPDGDINNASVVALLEHGGFRALLSGDAEAPVEALLLARGLVVPVDVLKVGHHGSDSSSTPALLSALRPTIAMISAGAGNEYGHPHPAALERLAAVPGITVLRTDLHGSVEVVVELDGLRIERRGKTDPGSIGPWPSRVWSARRRSSPRTGCRTGSSTTRAAWPGWRPRRRAWWPPPGCRSTCAWSRPPPSCTTWTSPRPAGRTRTA